MTRKIVSVLMACIFTGLSALTLHAADDTSVSTLLTVSCEAEDGDQNSVVIEPVDEDYRYTIREDTLTFSGSETKSFVLDFTEPGSYYYKIRQSAASSTSKYLDKTTHSVKVYVSWDSDGNLAAVPVIYQEGEREKELKIGFLNLPKAHYIENDDKNDKADAGNDTESEEIITETEIKTDTEAETGANAGTDVQTGDLTPVAEVWAILLGAAAAMVILAASKCRK